MRAASRWSERSRSVFGRDRLVDGLEPRVDGRHLAVDFGGVPAEMDRDGRRGTPDLFVAQLMAIAEAGARQQYVREIPAVL